MIIFENDPFQAVISAVHALYPDAVAAVQWVEGLHAEQGAWGCTEFDALPPGVALISLDASMPVSAAVEVLAHELAHVIAGPDAEHGPEWEQAFSAIHAEYCRGAAA